MRYAYIKNGDGVEQVRRLLGGSSERSGPDAFIGDLVRAHGADELLVLCRWWRRDALTAGRITARSYPLADGKALKPLHRAWTALQIGAAVLRWRPDRIVCGCSGELLWVCVLVAKLLRVPIVNSRHNALPARRGAARFASALERASIAACDGIVCHGPYLADQLRGLGLAGARIQQFEVDLSEFAAAAVDTVPPAPLHSFAARFDRIVMYVGRIQRDKGAFDLLDAFGSLPQRQGMRVGLVYVGEGRHFMLLQNAVRARSRQDCVLMLGAVAHAQLPQVMRQASVLVTPTRPELPEARCLVVLESLALGIPVIAPDCATFPYVIDSGVNGLLFAAGNVQALSQSLAQIVQDDELFARLRRGAAASARAFPAAHTGFAAAVERAFTRKVRLCIVLGGHWTVQIGGAQFQVKCLLDVIKTRPEFETYYLAHVTPENLHQDGHEVVRVGSAKLGNARVLLHLASIYRALRRLKPSVVYQRCLMPYTGVCAWYCSRHGTPFVFHIASDADVRRIRYRGWHPRTLLRRLSRQIAEYGLRHANVIIAQTAGQVRTLRAEYGLEATAVVPNFHPLPSQPPRVPDPAQMRVVWVGNFKPVKNPEIFVDLAAAFAARADMHFVMIGRPGEPRRYRALHERIGRLPNLDYRGELPLAEVDAAIAASDLLVNTSSAEGFPNTFIQAWLRGVPVVSAFVDPDGCLSDGGAGILAGSRERLGEVIAELQRDPQRLRDLGAAARRYACANHLPEQAQRLVELLASPRALPAES